MKTMNKVIAAMMMMALTTAMPVMAGNKNPRNDRNDKKTTVVVVNNDKGASHFDRSATKGDACQSKKVDKALSHHNAHKGHVYRPDIKTCTFKVSRHENHKKLVAKAENMKGVIDAKWNPRTREVTVVYDAKVTSARNIKHFMA